MPGVTAVPGVTVAPGVSAVPGVTRRPVAAVRRAAGVLFTLAALGGCGIQESDVVEAGGAATVFVRPGPEERAVLYFLGPDGRSMPVARDIHAPGAPAGAYADTDGFPASDPGRSPIRADTDKLLAALLSGPLPSEAARGITTDLPDTSTGFPHVQRDPKGAEDTESGRRRINIVVKLHVRKLSEAAVRQLVCTVAYAEHPAGLVDVTLLGIDGPRSIRSCEESF
ncbi:MULTISPECIES: hypothetical protein [unclassified Streptomyces]|uniref:hypothetical protein n=1 Tax=unclassified Streptomyces TaxID=2593676 RepID=UPI001660DE13|nr:MULTISPECIES: hypothetical protein [unclassified Streptomyces]